jgi:threonine dehydrogenase-like Zn-dependent dehydrogenase
MKAVVFHGIGDIRLDDVAEPDIEQHTDAIVRLTASAICGTDLHFVRGTFGGMKPGTIIGHEGVGEVEKLGAGVRNLNEGDRVVIPSTIACGTCAYCRVGHYAQCDNANPNGKRAGTCFFGGPEATGPVNGLQAELARIPYANVGLIKLPNDVTDDQALVLSDIFPTAWFGAKMAEIAPGNTVAVFGCGPVGQLVIASAKYLRAGRIIAVDSVESRLDTAREQGAETINFEAEDPVEAILQLTDGIGVDRAIDAVGVDSNRAHRGPASRKSSKAKTERDEIASAARPNGEHWKPGDAPSQALCWAVEALAKSGTLSIIGVYPPTDRFFPIGAAMNKNLTINMGNCHHRKYIPELLDLVRSGAINTRGIITQHQPLESALAAYQAFDLREPGWLKVELEPGRKAA